MTFEVFIYNLLTSTFVIGIVVWILKSKVQNMIRHSYNKSIEQYKLEIEAKKKAELVAKLLSEWLTFPEQQKELNKLTFEAFLWLPDDIARDLSDLLAHKKGSPEVRDVLLKIRKYLLHESTSLEAKDIIIFSQEHTKKLCEKAIRESNQVPENLKDSFCEIVKNKDFNELKTNKMQESI